MKKGIFMVSALGLLLLASCQHKDAHGEEADAHDAEKKAHSTEIVISTEQAREAGIVVERIVPGGFSGVIPAGGKILAASGNEATIVATVPGIVKLRQGITEGTPVGKGSTVFTISADKLQDNPAKQAAVAYQTAKAEYERAAKLVKDNIVTRKEFNGIRANYESAKIAYEALAGSRSGNGVAVSSPISGYVKTCLVREGDYVSVGQPMMNVTQTRKLYLKANVPERYYSILGTVRSARFKTAYSDRIYDIGTMSGRLVATGKSTGDGSPYIPVTFEFNNQADVMPGAFVETYLLTAKRANVISVLVSALTDENGVNFVYVQTDPTCYERREVTIGETDGERVEITSGLRGGEKVVTRGATQVRLAGASTSIPAHSHEH